MFVGIDVGGSKKGQALAVLDDELHVRELHGGLSVDEVVTHVARICDENASGTVYVGIDGPRMGAGGKGGRACEQELVRSLKVRLFWTPPADDLARLRKNEWMLVSFELFSRIEELVGPNNVVEVFPSAVYETLTTGVPVVLPLEMIHRKHKTDQLDAITCAFSCWAYARGACRVFGEHDPYGAIVVPCSYVSR